MKRLIILALLLVASFAMAEGPAGKTIQATTAGVAYVIQPPEQSAKNFRYTIVCPTDGITVTPWQYREGTGWLWFGPSSGIASPDSVRVPAGMIMPVEGRFHLLFITTDSIDADVFLHAYNN